MAMSCRFEILGINGCNGQIYVLRVYAGCSGAAHLLGNGTVTVNCYRRSGADIPPRKGDVL